MSFKTTVISIRVQPEQAEALAAVAANLSMPVSELTRRFISDGLARPNVQRLASMSELEYCELQIENIRSGRKATYGLSPEFTTPAV